MRPLLFMLLSLCSGSGWAHFQIILPATDWVVQGKSKQSLVLKFWHPFEGHGMPMERPRAMGVYHRGSKQDLLPQLVRIDLEDANHKRFSGYQLQYQFRRPGDHVFFVEPKPYWEATEKRFIVHFSKVVVSAFGLQQGWDRAIGLPVEIVPYTRPYGLYAGNNFSAKVLKKGKPLANAKVEIEMYQAKPVHRSPTDAHVTQMIKTNAKGEFTYTIPAPGWWGFAALTLADKKMTHGNKLYPVEWGGVFWVKAYAFPR